MTPAERLAAFVKSVRAGRVPSQKTLQWLAEAFSRVLDGALPTQDLDVALGVRKAVGRPRAPKRKPLRRVLQQRVKGHAFTREQIVDFVGARMLTDHSRGARDRAIADAADHFRVDPSTIERTWKVVDPLYKAWKPVAKRVQPMADAMALIREHITDAELDGPLGELPIGAAVKLARQRAKRRR